MAVYLIAEIKVTDDTWVPDYAANVHPLVEKHGGKYLSRSANIKVLEGEDRGNTFIAILQFPDAASVRHLQQIRIMLHTAKRDKKVL